MAQLHYATCGGWWTAAYLLALRAHTPTHRRNKWTNCEYSERKGHKITFDMRSWGHIALSSEISFRAENTVRPLFLDRKQMFICLLKWTRRGMDETKMVCCAWSAEWMRKQDDGQAELPECYTMLWDIRASPSTIICIIFKWTNLLFNCSWRPRRRKELFDEVSWHVTLLLSIAVHHGPPSSHHQQLRRLQSVLFEHNLFAT